MARRRGAGGRALRLVAFDRVVGIAGVGRVARLVALALGAVLLQAPPADALFGDTRGLGGVDGSLRTIGAGVRNPGVTGLLDARWDQISQTLLRLTAIGQPKTYLAYEFHGVQSVNYTSAQTGPAVAQLSLVPGDLRYRAFDATWAWHAGQTPGATFFIDRANVRVSLPHADVTVGRQAITWGKTYFWNPLDVFLAFDPRQFDQDYKPGIDAVRVQIPFGAFAGFEVVGAAGRTILATGQFEDPQDDVDATWFGSAVVARAFTTVRGFDLSLQGGKIYGGNQIGFSLAGEIGPLEVRGEAGQLFAQSGGPRMSAQVFGPDVPLVDDATVAVVGIGHRFESSLTLECEYFRNGFGDPQQLEESLVRFATGGTLDLSENLFAAAVSYELLPILLATVGTIVSIDDGSLQVQPRLAWSASDEVEVLGGAIISQGEQPALGGPLGVRLRSEFGSFADVYYAEVKWYF